MNNNIFLKPTDEFRNYKALEEIENNSSISQRDLASKLGVALGIANACIHTLIKKGFIKIHGKNNRSITYHLTKNGVLHKSKLAFEWSVNTVNFYREMRFRIKEELESLKKKNINTIFLVGVEELLELIQIMAPYLEIDVSGVLLIDDNNEIDFSKIPSRIEQQDKYSIDLILFCGVNVDKNIVETSTNIKASKLFDLNKS